MTIESAASFKAMLNDQINEDLKFKAPEIAAQYITEAAQLGVQMTLDDCYSLPAVRLHVIAGERITENWLDEAEATLPPFQKAAEERAVMEAVMDARNDRHTDAVAELEAELAKLSPAEKMSRARELGQRLPGPKTGARRELTAEEKGKALAEMER